MTATFEFVSRVIELPKIHDGALPTWLHLVPYGEWHYAPTREKINFTPEIVGQILARLSEYETRLAVDREHCSHLARNNPDYDDTIECYLDRFELRDDGIWGHVELWTAAGAADLAAGKYRYLSPTVAFKKPHKKTGEAGPEVFDAAVTNHPRLDGIKAFFSDTQAGDVGAGNTSSERSNAMLDKMKKWLKARGVTLADNAGDDVIAAAFEAESKKIEAADKKAALAPPELAKAAGLEGDEVKMADAIQALTAKLAPQVPEEVAKALGESALSVEDASGKIMQMRAASESAASVDTSAIAKQVRQQIDDEKLLADACADGRISPKAKDDFGALLFSDNETMRDKARAVIGGLVPNGPLAAGIAENGERPDGAGGFADDAAFTQCCEQMGLDPDDVRKQEKEYENG